MVDSAAHKSKWETSEVVFGIPLLVSIFICFLFPVPITSSVIRWVLLSIGIILCLAGIEIIILARRELSQHGQPTDPGRPTSQVVMSGIFSISRNPLYLGIVILFIGIAFTLNSLWFLILLVPAFIASHLVLIYPEERYLQAQFGDDYLVYRHSVNRWLGRRRRPK